MFFDFSSDGMTEIINNELCAGGAEAPLVLCKRRVFRMDILAVLTPICAIAALIIAYALLHG